MKRFALGVLLVTFAISARASKEGILAFSSFRLESAGIGSSGKIVIKGKQDENAKIVSLTINAFGKNYAVPPEKLARLADLQSNGIRISYEAGYPALGGRTIYIHLQMGFTSGTVKQALISISESGKIEVGEIEKKDA